MEPPDCTGRQSFHSIAFRHLWLGDGLVREFSAGPRALRPISLEFGASQGAVAQLGERLICIQEVVGSIPISSTSYNPWACSSGG